MVLSPGTHGDNIVLKVIRSSLCLRSWQNATPSDKLASAQPRWNHGALLMMAAD